MMFDLTRHTPNNPALVAMTGLSLTPVARALNGLRESRQTELTLPSLAPPTPSSALSSWLVSGYVGNFLDWVGIHLASVGEVLFSSPSITERKKSMRAAKASLKELFSQALLEEESDSVLLETLYVYLSSGRALVKADAISKKQWKDDLIELQFAARRAGKGAVAIMLGEWIAQVSVLLEQGVAQLDRKNSDLTQRSNVVQASRQAYREVEMTQSTNPSVPPLTQYPNPFELSGLNGGNGFQINGVATDDFSGWSVSGVGDMNADGYDDFIIGAPFASPKDHTNAGQSYVVFGKSTFTNFLDLSGLDGSNGFKINGIQANDKSGWSVSGAGDVNGDGYTDLIIGADLASP